MNVNKIIYASILTTAIIYGIVVHFTKCLEGILPSGGATMFYCEYISIAITLLCVFLAIRLFRKNIIQRMALLELPLLVDITCWGIFGTTSFFYLAVICLIAFAFVFPKSE